MCPIELVTDAHRPRPTADRTSESTAARDRQLICEASAGNVESFGELYDRYCDRAYRVAFLVCCDDGRAQDAAQEAFLAVWRSAASYRPEHGTVAAWLLTVVRYRAIDLARRNDKHATRRIADDRLYRRAAPDDAYDTAAKRDDARRLRASVNSLPDAQHEVITLAFYGQLSHSEIATHLGLPAGTVKGRVRLGLQKLRVDLGQAAA